MGEGGGDIQNLVGELSTPVREEGIWFPRDVECVGLLVRSIGCDKVFGEILFRES
jgi:hypothetical protein